MMITIRPYHPDDLKAALKLLDLNTPEYFAPEERPGYEKYLRERVGEDFVVEINGKVIGCGGVSYKADGHTAMFSWAMIHPQHQGKGFGRKLGEHRLEHIRSQPRFKTVVVRTSQFTYAFYQKLGFQLQKMEKDYWARGYDLYYMEMELR